MDGDRITSGSGLAAWGTHHGMTARDRAPLPCTRSVRSGHKAPSIFARLKEQLGAHCLEVKGDV